MNTKIILAAAGALFVCTSVNSGNYDRAGQAGATELLINPWARSAGFGNANSASITGLEAQFLNVAGTAFTRKTELLFTHTNWLVGAGIGINAFGFTQKVGETGVLGLGIMSMDFGDIQITTPDQPEGGIGTFSPQFFNLGISYAKAFSEDIYGGINCKVISESTADVNAKGVALDAGIQYVTGPRRNVKFGISMKNVGPRMKFQGDGLSFKGVVPATNASLTVEHRSAEFELPSLINIGGAYDFYFGGSKADSAASVRTHRITLAGTFTSNSFSKDEFRLGLEYGFKTYFMVRLGYNYEKGMESNADRTTVFTGPSGGVTAEIPIGQGGKTFGLDYSFRATQPFQGVHSIGARIAL